MNLRELLKKDNFTKEEIITLLELQSPEEQELLFNRAVEVRKEFFGDEILTRGTVKFSNYCGENCPYCGFQESNLSLKRYRMEPDEIIESAVQAYHNGLRRILLQSGKDSFFDTDIIAYLIYTIKQKTNLSVTLCLSERGLDEYKSWKIAGADRYMIRFTSSNPVLFQNFHKRNTFEVRLNHLKYLKRIGYKIGSGNFIGIPFQTTLDIANDLLLAKNFEIDIAAFSPFIPLNFISLKKRKMPAIDICLKTIAVARLLMKNIQIVSPYSLNLIEEHGRERGLEAGANVIMQNCTPQQYKNDLLIHPKLSVTKSNLSRRVN